MFARGGRKDRLNEFGDPAREFSGFRVGVRPGDLSRKRFYLL
jgi:hypothetical protein